jgi:hypothetical protein
MYPYSSHTTMAPDLQQTFRKSSTNPITSRAMRNGKSKTFYQVEKFKERSYTQSDGRDTHLRRTIWKNLMNVL